MIGQQKSVQHFPLTPVQSVGALVIIMAIGAVQSDTMGLTARAAQLFAMIGIITYLGLYAGYHDSDSMKNRLTVDISWFCVIASGVFQVYALVLSIIGQSIV